MVDEAVQAAKVAAVTDAVHRIRDFLPATSAELETNRTAREVVTLNLLVAIQEALSLATHWLADAGWKVPDTYGQVFLSLGEHGVIPEELACRLASAAGLRNLIAHQYGTIDAERLHNIASTGLDDLLAFCRELARRGRGET